MASEKITLNGEPVSLRIDSLNAKEVPSKFGDGKDYVYQCNGGENHIYLPSDAVESVRNSRARAGDLVTIQRRKEGQYVRWIVRVVSDAADPVVDPATRPRQPLPAKLYAQSGPVADTPTASGFVALSKCYRDAVDLAIDAVHYAAEQGLALPAPVFEDIRCISATLLIQGGKR